MSKPTHKININKRIWTNTNFTENVYNHVMEKQGTSRASLPREIQILLPRSRYGKFRQCRRSQAATFFSLLLLLRKGERMEKAR